MIANHIVNTSDYILGTESILTAARRLQKALDAGANRAKLEYAITGLESAAVQQDIKGADYHAFMFSELDTTAETDRTMRERMTEDVLASVLTDLQVANVLMAAGQAVGETGDQKEPKKLNDALFRLERTAQVFGPSLATPLAEGAEPGRFGFASGVSEPEVGRSADLPAAIETFRKCSNETLTSLVNDAKDVVMSVIKALSEIDADKALAALSNLGGKIGELSKVGRLFSWGVKKLQSAVNALLRLLGEDLLQQVKDQVKKLWEGLKDGTYVSGPLEWAFGVEATKKQIEGILTSQSLKSETLDEASNVLARLGIAFKQNMGMLSGIVAAISLAGTFLFFVPAIGQQAALVAASINSMILGTVVLIGMDYTDSGVLLKRIRGVREIAQGLVS